MNEMIWLLGGLVALAVGLWLVIAMRLEARKVDGKPRFADRARMNATAYKEQLRVLQSRHDEGEISQEQLQQAQTQLEQTLLSELDEPEKEWKDSNWSTGGKTVLASFVAIAAVVSFQLSNGQQHTQVVQSAEAPSSVEEMVANLANKLEENPQDLEGWVMLGRSYSVMRRYGESAYAYNQANQLTQQREPELLVAEAEALGLAAGQNLTGQPMVLIEKALELDKDNVRALWYALLMATQSGDEALQKSYLQRLEQQPELPPQLAELLRSEFSAQLAIDEADTMDSQSLALNIQVDIATDIQAQLPENASLFVYAKAQQGVPMPLAVAKQNLPNQWPVQIRLDDSMSMMDNNKLSNFDAWTIIARISPSGLAQPQSGDWEARLDVSAQDGPNQSITISRQIP